MLKFLTAGRRPRRPPHLALVPEVLEHRLDDDDDEDGNDARQEPHVDEFQVRRLGQR